MIFLSFFLAQTSVWGNASVRKQNLLHFVESTRQWRIFNYTPSKYIFNFPCFQNCLIILDCSSFSLSIWVYIYMYYFLLLWIFLLYRKIALTTGITTITVFHGTIGSPVKVPHSSWQLLLAPKLLDLSQSSSQFSNVCSILVIPSQRCWYDQ